MPSQIEIYKLNTVHRLMALSGWKTYTTESRAAYSNIELSTRNYYSHLIELNDQLYIAGLKTRPDEEIYAEYQERLIAAHMLEAY